MRIDLTVLNKKLLSEQAFTPEELDFVFAKRDIEEKHQKLLMMEMEVLVEKHSHNCVNEILELYEKTKEKLDDKDTN